MTRRRHHGVMAVRRKLTRVVAESLARGVWLVKAIRKNLRGVGYGG